jgi:cobalt/nickel transport system permease protein
MLFELFSDIFTIRQNRLSGVDPRVKLITAMAAAILAIQAKSPLFPALLFIGAVAGAMAVSVPLRHVTIRFAAPTGMAIMTLLLKTFMTDGETLGAWSMGGIPLTATREGLYAGALISARVMGAVGALQLLSFVTPAHQVFRALAWMGAPKGWVEVAMMMYRFSFDIFERAADIGAAQRVRLGYSAAARSVSSAGTLAGAVALGAMEKAARVEEAMVARGYRGDIPYRALKPMACGEAMAIAGSALALALLFTLCEAVWPL